MSASSIRIHIEIRSHGAQGPRFTVRANTPDGMVLIESTTEPLYDGARLLVAKGIKGEVQLWDSERPYCRMRGDIEKLARLTISEGDASICLRRYAERATGGDFASAARSGAGDESGRPEDVPQQLPEFRRLEVA